MKYAICNEIFDAEKNWPWERVCAFCREMGYAGVEVAPFTLAAHVSLIDDKTRAQLRRIGTGNHAPEAERTPEAES